MANLNLGGPRIKDDLGLVVVVASLMAVVVLNCRDGAGSVLAALLPLNLASVEDRVQPHLTKGHGLAVRVELDLPGHGVLEREEQPLDDAAALLTLAHLAALALGSLVGVPGVGVEALRLGRAPEQQHVDAVVGVATAAADGASQCAPQLLPAAAPGWGACLNGGDEGVCDYLVWVELGHWFGLLGWFAHAELSGSDAVRQVW